MKEFIIYKSPWKAVKLLLLTSIFVGGGIWLILSEDAESWIGWMSISVFGLGIPLGLFNLFDKRPQIIINKIGIRDRVSKQDIIKWEIIQNAYLTNVDGQKFVCLKVDEAYEPSNKKGKWYKMYAKLNKSLGFQELMITLGQVKVDEVKLTEIINAMTESDIETRNERLKLISD